MPQPLSKEDKDRAAAAITTIFAVRMAQLVCAGFILWDLWTADCMGAIILGLLFATLHWALPEHDAGLARRLDDAGKDDE